MPVTVRSFAKINLGLRIGGLRADGFHDLLTVYQTVGLHDVIQITVARGRGIEIRCADPRVPRDESNTCFRIVEKAVQLLGAKGRIVVELDKRLPVQGGLGGASSNAVAALLGLERALNKTLPAAEKLRIAAEVGSDLPLFLVGGTVLGVGRGEQVYPLQGLPATACVVVTPEVGVSTPKAFAAWDWLCGSDAPSAGSRQAVTREVVPLNSNPSKEPDSAELGSAPLGQRPGPAKTFPWRAGSVKLTQLGPSDRMIELSRALSAWLSEPFSGAPFGRGRAENPLLELVRAGIENDFERVAFPEYPELREGKRALKRAGAKYASLSGSGSTLYGLFQSREAAVKAATGLRKQGWAAQSTVTLTRGQYWKKIFD